MAVFSVNQNRHLYVVKDVKTISENGDIEVKSVGEGNAKEIFFLYKNLQTGEVIKSDRIPVKNLDYVKLTEAADMVKPLKSIKVELADGTSLVAGQDYVLRIVFRQFYGMSDQDQYIKDVAVHCTSAMVSTPANFWTALEDALNLAFSREIGATKTANPYLTFTKASTSLTIMEKPQKYVRGIGAQERVYFDVIPTTVYDGSDEYIWGKNTDTTVAKASAVVGTNALGNGTDIADLEWFCMGERGDQYRMAGWPNYIPTEYCVDPNEEYDVLDIHFAFTDTGVNSYRSEKDIIIVSKESGVAEEVQEAIEEIVNPSEEGG